MQLSEEAGRSFDLEHFRDLGELVLGDQLGLLREPGGEVLERYLAANFVPTQLLLYSFFFAVKGRFQLLERFLPVFISLRSLFLLELLKEKLKIDRARQPFEL